MPEIDRMLLWPELARLIPFSRVHVGRLEAAGLFPRRYQIGSARVAWRLSEVEAWLATRHRGPLPIGPNSAAEAHPEP